MGCKKLTYQPQETTLKVAHSIFNNVKKTSAKEYLFGYQGSEKDNEVNSSNGSSYTTEFRQLDTRLGRWFSSDPVFQPWQSSYTSMDNNPISYTDVRGLSKDNGDGTATVDTKGESAWSVWKKHGEGKIKWNRFVELNKVDEKTGKADGKTVKVGTSFKIKEPAKQNKDEKKAEVKEEKQQKRVEENKVPSNPQKQREVQNKIKEVKAKEEKKKVENISSESFLDRSVLSFDLEGQFSIGGQAGFKMDAGGSELSLYGNMGAVSLFKINYEQQKSDDGPSKFELNYVLKNNMYEYNQGGNIGFFIVHGGYNRQITILRSTDEKQIVDKVEGGAGYGPFGLMLEKKRLNDSTVVTRYGWKLSGQAALIFGIEGTLFFGVTDELLNK